MRIRWLALAVLVSGAAGCDALGIFGGDNDESTLVTDGEAFALVEASVGVGTEIPITFTNRSGEPIYIVNCNGQLSTHLEKRVEGEWVGFWGGITDLCLSPPIVIEPGSDFSATVKVWAAYPSDNHRVYPRWPDTRVAGEYRLVLHSMVFAYDPDQYPFGPDVPRAVRTSNAFLLTGP